MTSESADLDLESLIAAHRRIDLEVDRLGSCRHLLQFESDRLKTLKIQKLRLKDVICQLGGGMC